MCRREEKSGGGVDAYHVFCVGMLACRDSLYLTIGHSAKLLAKIEFQVTMQQIV